jgi:hypothetical protein
MRHLFQGKHLGLFFCFQSCSQFMLRHCEVWSPWISLLCRQTGFEVEDSSSVHRPLYAYPLLFLTKRTTD